MPVSQPSPSFSTRHRCAYDIRPPSSRFARSMGCQHVLEPELRIRNSGAKSFSQQLLTKAAERLRYGDYYCRRLGLHLSWIGDLGGFWDDISFHETRDAGFLIACLDKLWRRVPRYKPLSVDVVCSTWCQPIGTSPISSSTTGGRNCRLWSTVSTTATAAAPSALACCRPTSAVPGSRRLARGVGVLIMPHVATEHFTYKYIYRNAKPLL